MELETAKRQVFLLLISLISAISAPLRPIS